MSIEIEHHKKMPENDFGLLGSILILNNLPMGKDLNGEQHIQLKTELRKTDGVYIARRENDAVGFLSYCLWRKSHRTCPSFNA